MGTERPWWRSWFGVPRGYDRWQGRRRWDDGLQSSPRVATVAVVAIVIGGASVLAGYVAEWQGWHGLVVGLSVAWLVGAVAFVAAVLVSSRRSGRPFWWVAWDGVRGLLRFVFETW